MNTDSNQLLAGMSVPLIDPELLSDIVATAGDISLVVSADGHVISVLPNPHHASFGRLSHWVGRKASEITVADMARSTPPMTAKASPKSACAWARPHALARVTVAKRAELRFMVGTFGECG